jgi:hypothetical protein
MAITHRDWFCWRARSEVLELTGRVRSRFSLNASTTMLSQAMYRAEADTGAPELLMAVQPLKLSE